MCKKFKRDSVLIYKSVFNVIRQLPYDQRWATLEAIIMYGLEGAAAPLTGLPQAIFELAVPLIDANNRRYAKRAGLDPACCEPARRSEMYAPDVPPEYMQAPEYVQPSEYMQAPDMQQSERMQPTEYMQQAECIHAPEYVQPAPSYPYADEALGQMQSPSYPYADEPMYVQPAPRFVVNPVDDQAAAPSAQRATRQTTTPYTGAHTYEQPAQSSPYTGAHMQEQQAPKHPYTGTHTCEQQAPRYAGAMGTMAVNEPHAPSSGCAEHLGEQFAPREMTQPRYDVRSIPSPAAPSEADSTPVEQRAANQAQNPPEFMQPALRYEAVPAMAREMQPAPRERAAHEEYIQQAPNYVPKAAPAPKAAPSPRSAPAPKAVAQTPSSREGAPLVVPNETNSASEMRVSEVAPPKGAPVPRSAPTPKAVARAAYMPDYVSNAPSFVVNPVDDPMATPYACTTPVGEPYISLDSAGMRAAPKMARGAYAPDYVPNAPSFVVNPIDDSGVPLSAADGDVSQRESRSRPFVPPTVEQVAKYCASSGLNVNAQRFVDFYASKGWLVGNSPMRCWQASVRKWSESPVAPSGRAAAQLKQSSAFVGGTPCEQRSYTEEELNALFTPLEE